MNLSPEKEGDKMNRKTYNGLTFKPYINRDEISERITRLGGEITRDYEGRRPLVVCVLNGAFHFASDLFRAIEIDAEIAFIRLQSYEGTASTGAVKQVMGLTTPVKDRDIIIVEDIVDTGNTIVNLKTILGAEEPRTMKVATLLFKPQALQHPEVKPDYVGFEIPSKFIIGFGLDLDGLARNLPDIWVLDEGEE